MFCEGGEGYEILLEIEDDGMDEGVEEGVDGDGQFANAIGGAGCGTLLDAILEFNGERDDCVSTGTPIPWVRSCCTEMPNSRAFWRWLGVPLKKSVEDA